MTSPLPRRCDRLPVILGLLFLKVIEMWELFNELCFLFFVHCFSLVRFFSPLRERWLRLVLPYTTHLIGGESEVGLKQAVFGESEWKNH